MPTLERRRSLVGTAVNLYDAFMKDDKNNPLSELGASPTLLGEFWDFIKHNKLWWMTPIVLVLVAMVAFIIFAESAPVLPFIYAL
jgi:hypothetical protein